MSEKIKCDCGVIFTPEEGQTHCNYCGIKLIDFEEKALQKALQKLTLEDIDNVIRAYEENVEEMETALRNGFEYPSDKQRYELVLIQIKEKKGWFFNIFRKYVKHKLRKINNKPPKKLNKDSRKFLEEWIEAEKWKIVDLRELRKKKISD
jgi:hypothetical protein